MLVVLHERREILMCSQTKRFRQLLHRCSNNPRLAWKFMSDSLGCAGGCFVLHALDRKLVWAKPDECGGYTCSEESRLPLPAHAAYQTGLNPSKQAAHTDCSCYWQNS